MLWYNINVSVQKIVAGGMSLIVLGSVIVSSLDSDNDLVARLNTVRDQPHLPHNNYPVPQYTSGLNTMNATGGTASAQTLNFQSF